MPSCASRHVAPPVPDSVSNESSATKDSGTDETVIEVTDSGLVEEEKISTQILPASPFTVCGDSLYQSLKKKNIEIMTEREFQYFIQRDGSCCDSLLKDERTEFHIKESPEGLYRVSTIIGIIISSISITFTTILMFEISANR